MTSTNEQSTQTVLVVGGTGMLGGQIAAALLAEPGAAVRLLVRPGAQQDPRRARALDGLRGSGAGVVEADLTDAARLSTALDGVDVVVSAVQGGPDVIVEGQVALAEAAVRAGVRRILPSDFALDLFKAPPGLHAAFDLRRRADDRIAETGLEHVHVLNGAFMEGFIGRPFFDHDARTVTFWGSGEEVFEATTVGDTARYTALAALDRDLPSGKLLVAGDELSFGQMADVVEEITGHPYQRRSLGSVAELRASINRRLEADGDAMAVLMDVYQLFMASGETALDKPQNSRWPDVVPTSFRTLARAGLAG